MAQEKKKVGRPATGRRQVHSINVSLDMDVHQWLTEHIDNYGKSKFINQLIRKEAGLC